MSESKTSLKLTKAGVALSAETRAKLQRLADWMEVELTGPQDPRVRLSYLGGLSKTGNTTYVTPLAALVQMYDPFKLSEAKVLNHDVYKVEACKLQLRTRELLGITPGEYYQLLGYMYHRTDFQDVIQALRTLK